MTAAFDLASVPELELARLKKREKAQRRETLKRGLPAEAVSVDGLLLLQEGKCGHCGKPLIFDHDHPDREAGKPVIAHVFFRAGINSPGHTRHNVEIWHYECNQAMAAKEKSDQARGARCLVRDVEREPKPDAVTRPAKPRWGGRSFQTNRNGPFKQKIDGKVVRR